MKAEKVTVVVFDMQGESQGDVIAYEADAEKFQREYERLFPFTCSEDLIAVHNWLKENAVQVSKTTPDYSFTMPFQ